MALQQPGKWALDYGAQVKLQVAARHRICGAQAAQPGCIVFCLGVGAGERTQQGPPQRPQPLVARP